MICCNAILQYILYTALICLLCQGTVSIKATACNTAPVTGANHFDSLALKMTCRWGKISICFVDAAGMLQEYWHRSPTNRSHQLFSQVPNLLMKTIHVCWGSNHSAKCHVCEQQLWYSQKLEALVNVINKGEVKKYFHFTVQCMLVPWVAWQAQPILLHNALKKHPLELKEASAGSPQNETPHFHVDYNKIKNPYTDLN